MVLQYPRHAQAILASSAFALLLVTLVSCQGRYARHAAGIDVAEALVPGKPLSRHRVLEHRPSELLRSRWGLADPPTPYDAIAMAPVCAWLQEHGWLVRLEVQGDDFTLLWRRRSMDDVVSVSGKVRYRKGEEYYLVSGGSWVVPATRVEALGEGAVRLGPIPGLPAAIRAFERRGFVLLPRE